jgi:hypothetical protein
MTSTIETTTLTLDGTELAGMLTDLASLAAKPGDHVPVMESIRLHTSEGLLHGWSSDRYRAGHAVMKAEGELPEPVFLRASDVKQISAAFKAWPHGMAVSVDAGKATFTNGAASLTVSLVGPDVGEYPNLASVLKGRLPVSDQVVRFAPAYVEAFTKIAKRRGLKYLEFATGNGKSTHVRIGESFRGWLMPGRPLEDPVWLSNDF